MACIICTVHDSFIRPATGEAGVGRLLPCQPVGPDLTELPDLDGASVEQRRPKPKDWQRVFGAETVVFWLTAP